ncbi:MULTISPECIES: DUF742 domain-containing protein [unclassified Amycolatopsis]|uniref:DUF742 domain-containing protein n=1 Tax=unclassified Amycolatopsis TaxID=2618356 RepID=UPI0028759528|nr:MULTISPECIES: DUF742 domain-containing protein [unclassified Amycolatopsis]MDS0133428.1 DUF742 domain-containing protein [Amycolatopsis sp. 505]MDS0146658.1 DUF742 domain-containing protein [Amycolatopsis sp. CM201R]
MRISGFDDPDSSGWDALHRGTEREGFDSPSKFDMSTLSMIMPKRKPSRPQPDAEGYTDEDTREWGSSADDEEEYVAPEPVEDEPTGRRARRSRSYAGEDDRRDPTGYHGKRSPEAGEDYARPEPGGFPTRRAPDFSGDEPARPAFGGYQNRRAPESGDEPPLPDPFGYQGTHSPVVADDGYDPVEPEWQDDERFEPEPPPLEPAWTPPRGARPPAPPSHQRSGPRPPAPRPPAPRPPAPVSRPHPVAPPVSRQAAPPPAWAPPPADWTPPPDPETRWIPNPEPWEDPAWNEPARVVSPVPVASPGSRVRPYTRTGGRTRSDHNLALEALVSTSDDGRRYRGVRSVEHRRICDLCLDTRSVAEIAAHLRLPLGVVKVLVGDMADIGLVLIHQTELILGDRSSREFMERVLAGLRAL